MGKHALISKGSTCGTCDCCKGSPSNQVTIRVYLCLLMGTALCIIMVTVLSSYGLGCVRDLINLVFAQIS